MERERANNIITELWESYQNGEQRGGDLIMSRFVLVCVQHEESKQGTEKADTQLAKKENNISNNIYFPYTQNVIHY